MPTVTVLAWCLIASTGRVSSSIALGERGGEVLTTVARRADLAVLDLVRVERERAGGVAEQRAEPHRGARLERAVVRCRRAARRRSVRAGASIASAEAVEQPVGRRRCAVGLDRGPALAQRTRRTRRSRARPRSRTGGRPRSRARSRARGARRDRDRLERGRVARRRRRRSRSARRCARGRSRPPCPTSSAFEPDEPGRAHEDQRLRRQVDVLLVLGDVAGDRLVAELRELDPHLVRGDRVRRRCRRPPSSGGSARGAARPRRSSSRLADDRRASRRAARAGRAAARAPQPSSSAPTLARRARTRAGTRRRSARRTPSSTRRSSPRRGRRTCRARRRTCRRDRCCAGSRSRARSRRGRARGRRCGSCRWWCRSG